MAFSFSLLHFFVSSRGREGVRSNDKPADKRSPCHFAFRKRQRRRFGITWPTRAPSWATCMTGFQAFGSSRRKSHVEEPRTPEALKARGGGAKRSRPLSRGRVAREVILSYDAKCCITFPLWNLCASVVVLAAESNDRGSMLAAWSRNTHTSSGSYYRHRFWHGCGCDWCHWCRHAIVFCLCPYRHILCVCCRMWKIVTRLVM